MVAWLGVAATNAAVAAVAVADSYSVMTGNQLNVPAPGVLDNDTFVVGAGAADLRDDVDRGTLSLDEDGSFQYQPDSGFVGTDTFKYRIPSGLLLLLPSNTVMVTITVTAPPPTPTPTPAPTPAPTPDPTATPRPLVPLPSLPLPTLPLPTLRPLPTLLPQPTPTPTASARSGATPTPPPTSGVGDRPSDPPVAGPAGPVRPPRSGSGPGPGAPSSAPDEPPFVVSANGEDFGLETGAFTFNGFEWAVPALVLTVPGLLIVIAVLVQSLIGLAWLPLTRRWLGNDRSRQVLQRRGAR